MLTMGKRHASAYTTYAIPRTADQVQIPRSFIKSAGVWEPVWNSKLTI